jgi:hypothetical protein
MKPEQERISQEGYKRATNTEKGYWIGRVTVMTVTLKLEEHHAKIALRAFNLTAIIL